MKAIILAAGQGIRLGNDFSEQPKCLLNIGDKTILEKQVVTLSNIGVKDISVVIGAKGSCWSQKSYNIVKKTCGKVIINFDNDITYNAYSAYLAFQQSEPDDILLMDGDVVFNVELITKILSSKYNNVMISKIAENKREVGCRLISDDTNQLVHIGKNIIDIKFPWDIYSSIIKIKKESFSSFYKQLNNPSIMSEELDVPIREFINNDDIYILRTSKNEWVNVNTQNELIKSIELFSN